MAGKQRFHVAELEAALVATGGLPAQAASWLRQNTGRACSRQTVCGYLARHPRLAAVRVEQRETLVDVAEARLAAAVNRGEPWAVRTCLTTLGRERGYITRGELTGPEGGPIAVEAKGPDLSKLSVAELEQLEQLVVKAESEGQPAPA